MKSSYTERRTDRERWRERESFNQFTPQVATWPEWSWVEARSQELLLGLPRGYKVARIGGILCYLSRSLAESWMGSEVVGTQTGAHMGCCCGRCRISLLCHCSGPQSLVLMWLTYIYMTLYIYIWVTLKKNIYIYLTGVSCVEVHLGVLFLTGASSWG